jgi:hypothetical protein
MTAQTVLLALLARHPLTRWQVWLKLHRYNDANGIARSLPARDVIAAIDEAIQQRLVYEHEGELHLCVSPAIRRSA